MALNSADVLVLQVVSYDGDTCHRLPVPQLVCQPSVLHRVDASSKFTCLLLLHDGIGAFILAYHRRVSPLPQKGTLKTCYSSLRASFTTCSCSRPGRSTRPCRPRAP